MRRLTSIAGIVAVTLVLAACGGDDGGEGDGGTTGATGATGGTANGGGNGGGGGAATLTMQGFVFSPNTLSISGPTEVTVENKDSAAHTFTLDDGSVDVTVGGGETTTVTVDVSASTGFVCRFHPSMTGTVEVG